MRKIGVVLLLVTLVTSTWYFFAYLTLVGVEPGVIAGILMVAAEIGLVTILLLSRLGQDRAAGHRRQPGGADQGSAGRRADLQLAALRLASRPEPDERLRPGAARRRRHRQWAGVARRADRPRDEPFRHHHRAEQGSCHARPPEGGFLGGEDPIDLLQRPVTR